MMREILEIRPFLNHLLASPAEYRLQDVHLAYDNDLVSI